MWSLPIAPDRSTVAPTCALRGAPGAPSASRPKRLVAAREDRGEDRLPTVEAAQIVELVGLRVGDVPSSRPIGGGRVVAAWRAHELLCTCVAQRLLR